MNEIKESKNKLVCTVTGATVRVAPKVFAERAKKYGSEEALRLNYIGSVGRKLLCEGKTVEEIRALNNVPSTVPVPSADTVARYTRWAKYRNSTKTAPSNSASN